MRTRITHKGFNTTYVWVHLFHEPQKHCIQNIQKQWPAVAAKPCSCYFSMQLLKTPFEESPLWLGYTPQYISTQIGCY